MRGLDCRLGLDVGGTNTDAVIMNTADRVIAKAKVPGTADITGGIVAAIDAVLQAPGVDPRRITHVMLGTTHATNAVLERVNLRRVAVIRIGGPATHSIRPMFSWPHDLVDAVSVGAAIVDGGIEFDGRDLSPLDTDAIARFLGQVGEQAEGVSITSVFAPVSARHELLAAEVVKRELGEVHLSLSHEIGSIGMLERENATILNGALAGVARDVARAMRSALTAHGLDPVTFFAQNDGTLMGLDQALRYPVLTIGSGPANSVRGAAFLTGLSDSLVADVGGTSTDVGVLTNGFPRDSSQGVEIGGVRTNFRMPDLVTIALGGGTVIAEDASGVLIGPRSVGYRLTQEALVFGGQTPTLTDAAVAAGRAEIGQDLRDERGSVPASLLAEALARADMMLADAIDRVKTSREDRPLIAVGGGSILVPECVPGVSEIIRPEHFDAANAVGAAIASVSGQVDRIFHYGEDGRRAILEEAQDEARERAVAAGADPGTVEIIEVEEIPLAYLTTPAARVRVKAAGALGGLGMAVRTSEAPMKRHHGWLAAAATVPLLTLAACSGSASPPSASSQSQPANAVFTYDTTAPVMVDGWDPATEYSDGILAMSEMYETLTHYDAATKTIEPMLATSWSSSADGKTWTFHLRHGVYFHTGRLMTAQAAKDAIQRTIKLGGGAAYLWGAVTTIDTPDQYTLVLHQKYPSPLSLEASADYSAYIYDTQAGGGGSKLTSWLNAAHDAGTGPYTVQKWNKGQELEVTLTKFGKYWGGWSGSHFSKVVFRVVPQDSTAAQLLRSGQVSFIEQISPSLWSSFKGDSGIKLVQGPSWQNLLAQFNVKAMSLPVRQAVSYAIDYQGILAALRGAGVASSGLVPPGMFGHSSDLPVYSHDKAKAASLLNSAGYGPGKKALNLSLTYTQGDSNEQVAATIIKSDLAALNVHLSVQALAWPTQWARGKSNNAAQRQDIFMEYWWPDYPDPYSWFQGLLQTESPPYYNMSYYSNPSLDKQINGIEQLVATNKDAAAQLYRNMQVTVLQQAPLVPVYDDNYQYAMLSGISGLKVNPAYPNVVFVYDLKP
ncbi:MAG TPA: ABC transporter substrate-binding protein [Streptosporangiaceae bacterium]|nr:ABC transporter substrate-binding protein [Streptosporangiaceae bacterium]